MRLKHIKGAEEAVASSPFVIHDAKTRSGTWRQLFGNENPIHIEIGMGKGRFLMELAALLEEPELEEGADILSVTAVDTADVGRGVGTVRSGAGQTLVAFGQYLEECLLGVEDVLRKRDARIDGFDVEILHARTQTERERCGQSDQNYFVSFHISGLF